MQIKPGVKLDNLKPQTVVAMMVAESTFQRIGEEFVITSGSEGQHMVGSKHYEGYAFDCRTRGLNVHESDQLYAELKGGLGLDFDVVREVVNGVPHCHIEYDPKGVKKA